jgi:hypothetical protein
MLPLLFFILALATLSLTLNVTDFLLRGILWLVMAVFLILAGIRFLLGRGKAE